MTIADIPAPFLNLARALTSEPFCHTLAVIADLTPWQLGEIYCCSRDEHGRPLPEPGPAEEYRSERDWFAYHLELNGVFSPAAVEVYWRQHQVESKHAKRQADQVEE